MTWQLALVLVFVAGLSFVSLRFALPASRPSRETTDPQEPVAGGAVVFAAPVLAERAFTARRARSPGH